MAKKEVKIDLWVARQLDDSKIKYDAQGSDVKEINDALQSASKRGTGNAVYPEYVAVVKDFVIVIEDKADLAKHQRLTSTGILSVDQKDIADYAVNGAYFYAKHIAQNSSFHKIFAIGVSGDEKHHISPKYVQTIESKPVSEWIIAVGKHEGFIPSEQWIEVQELLDAIAEKYNRPHRKTNALLAGLAHCPHCGRRLSVISESDRWTNGKPRFKYVCPGYRKKECNFKAVDGVLLDEFVVQQLSELSDENSERFRRILEIKIEEILEQSQTVQEHNIIKKKRDKLKADIAAQTRNLREADGSIKQFIQEDLQNLAEELRETERQLSKLDEGRKNNMIAIRDLEMTKERLLSFAEYAKDA